MPRYQGWTLLEALIAVAVLGTLISLAGPAFGNLRRDNARTTAVNAWIQAVYLARSETARRGEIVTICKSKDGSMCGDKTTNWHDGWIVFVDQDRDASPQRDAGEPLLLVNQGWSAGTITSNRATYSFRPYQQGVVNGTVVFCDARGSAHARAIIVSHTGRPRIVRHGADNKPLRCP
jgi:type IV fimbrial biogenesis protein FimT